MRIALASLVALALALPTLANPQEAHAQGYGPGYYQGPPPPHQHGVLRSGLILGGSIGLGGIFTSSCDDFDGDCEGLGAFGLQFHLGGMVGPQLAVVFDMSGMYHVFDDDSLLTSATFLGVLRGWLGNNLWLQAGLGLGYLEATDESRWFIIESRTGIAAMIGAGIEVLQTPTFALDIQLRLSGARYSYLGDDFTISNAGVFVGFNWY